MELLVNKKQKISIITIVLAIIFSALIFLFNPLFYVSQEFGKLDSDLKHLLTTIVVAGLAGSLFAFRNKIKGEFLETIEAMELLILIVIPSVEIFSFIMKDPSNYSLAIAPYVLAVMAWYLIIILRHKTIQDPKREKIFLIQIHYVLAGLLLIAVLAFWLSNSFNFWMKIMS